MNQKGREYHTSVLLKESLEGLNINPSGVYVDATFGGGGHSCGILGHLNEKGRLFGFDQDIDAEKNILKDRRFVFVRSNFRYLSNFMRYHKEPRIDGLVADLGLSSHHLDDATRGFSFRSQQGLDMRMNNRSGRKAEEILNTYSEKQLADVFYLYGELRNSRKIAAAVVNARMQKPLVSTLDLLHLLSPLSGRVKEKKFLAQVFQSLRIEVNQEMQALCELLRQSLKLLKTKGRLVVITYHSLEDRIVKNFVKTGNVEGCVEQNLYGNIQPPFRQIGKVLVPTANEIDVNPRARSAKLRVAEKYRD